MPCRSSLKQQRYVCIMTVNDGQILGRNKCFRNKIRTETDEKIPPMQYAIWRHQFSDLTSYKFPVQFTWPRIQYYIPKVTVELNRAPTTIQNAFHAFRIKMTIFHAMPRSHVGADEKHDIDFHWPKMRHICE